MSIRNEAVTRAAMLAWTTLHRVRGSASLLQTIHLIPQFDETIPTAGCYPGRLERVPSHANARTARLVRLELAPQLAALPVPEPARRQCSGSHERAFSNAPGLARAVPRGNKSTVGRETGLKRATQDGDRESSRTESSGLRTWHA
jgi:hypothetical protein